MSASRSSEENLLLNPMFRYAMALGGSAIMVVVAVLFLEGTIRWLVLGLAVVNAVVEPKILEMAGRQEAQAEG